MLFLDLCCIQHSVIMDSVMKRVVYIIVNNFYLNTVYTVNINIVS